MFFAKRKAIISLKILKKKVKKLVLVWTISMPIIGTKKEASEDAKTFRTDENGKNNKNKDKGENLVINLTQVPSIQYSITF